ncbi:hypothetical protein [Streptomyces dubilierae]|uniref:MarR family transcriptional regulator n=1 Tax=Streptomyces dubilierae TaxID=3075533 RepID=A0ABU2PA59_9ACTN|nr:hypothetical protein [Streptomyces sp. DSM 41921]MDT0387914.1 hypothetical protein [Streptomyces sp. DSM 41921]
MPRSYTMTPAARDARRKGAEMLNSTDGLIKRLVDRAPTLTPEQAAKIRALLAEFPGENETAATTGGEIE